MANDLGFTATFERLKSAMDDATNSAKEFASALHGSTGAKSSGGMNLPSFGGQEGHSDLVNKAIKQGMSSESGSSDLSEIFAPSKGGGKGGMSDIGKLLGGGEAGAGEAAAGGEAAVAGGEMAAGEMAAGAAGGPIGIAAMMAKKKAEETIKSLQSAGAHVMKGIQTESVTGAAGQGLRAVGDVAGNFGPVGKAVEGTLKFGAAVLESVDKVRSFAKGLHDANMRFAEFSGSMAGVQARSEVRRIQREQQQGERRTESAEKLATAQDRLSESLAPLEDIWANFKGDVTSSILDVLTDTSEVIKEWFGMEKSKGGEPNENFNEWMKTTAEQHDWAAKFQRPKRFNS